MSSFDFNLKGAIDLQNDIREFRDDWSTERAYVVGTNVEYAPDVEFGTSAHVITPDDAEALRFEYEGDVIYRTRVEHPGTPAQPYLRPAVREVRNELDEHASEAETANQWLAKVAFAIERKAKQKVPVDTTNLKGSIRTERVK